MVWSKTIIIQGSCISSQKDEKHVEQLTKYPEEEKSKKGQFCVIVDNYFPRIRLKSSNR